MKVLVFGANGKTGRLVVEVAQADGHEVSIFVHEAQDEPVGVHMYMGDAADAVAVRAAVAGHDAVIDAIGGKTPYKETHLESIAAKNIIDGMQAEGVKRLVVVSMMGIGDSKEQTPFWYEHLLLPTFLRGADKDKTEMEAEVKASGLDFVIARPPFLTDGEPTRSVVALVGDEIGHKITRADLAQFLVDQLTSDSYLGQAVVIANS